MAPFLTGADNHDLFPAYVQFDNGTRVPLPEQDIISFGRLREKDGLQANDIVLQCPEEKQTLQISRWHFELRRGAAGYSLKALSDSATHVNGQLVAKGDVRLIRPGDSVRVGNVLSLHFLGAEQQSGGRGGGETIVVPSPENPQFA